jgi:outer membrane protein TolC
LRGGAQLCRADAARGCNRTVRLHRPQTASAAPALEGYWWRLYNDPVLDRLVANALNVNTDQRVALAHLERARASLREARADRTPQVNIWRQRAIWPPAGSSARTGRGP